MIRRGLPSCETISLEKFATYVARRVLKFMEVIRSYLGVLCETDVKVIPTRLRSSKPIIMMRTRINAGSSQITALPLTMSF